MQIPNTLSIVFLATLNSFIVVYPLKKAFYSRQCTTERASLAYFRQVFDNIDQDTIQGLYNSYTIRLNNCRRADGQMTKY